MRRHNILESEQSEQSEQSEHLYTDGFNPPPPPPPPPPPSLLPFKIGTPGKFGLFFTSPIPTILFASFCISKTIIHALPRTACFTGIGEPYTHSSSFWCRLLHAKFCWSVSVLNRVVQMKTILLTHHNILHTQSYINQFLKIITYTNYVIIKIIKYICYIYFSTKTTIFYINKKCFH